MNPNRFDRDHGDEVPDSTPRTYTANKKAKILETEAEAIWHDLNRHPSFICSPPLDFFIMPL